MPNLCLQSSAQSPVLCALSSLLRSKGLASAAVIDDHVFFHLPHSPMIHCAPVNDGVATEGLLRAVARDEDLVDLKLSESVKRFVDVPGSFCSQSKGLVRSFLGAWATKVARASCAPDLIHLIVDGLLEVEHWLSDDGPGACVIVGKWVMWTSGRHGMSDLQLAQNLGDRPAPDMATASRWDSISTLNIDDLHEMLYSLQEWHAAPSVWSFRNRAVPA